MNDKRLNGFDRIAGFYDWLAWLAFGDVISKAQHHFLQEVPSSAKILILGGGSGGLLASLTKSNPFSEIWYVEASHRMITLAQQRLPKVSSSHIHFVHGTEDNLPAGFQFDAVITPFVLDVFSDESLPAAVDKIRKAMSVNAKWLVSDFTAGETVLQKGLLQLMYLFFRMTAAVEARRLPDWNGVLSQSGLSKIKSARYQNGFIEAAVYLTTPME